VIAFSDATNAAIVGPLIVFALGLLAAGWKFGMNLRDELRHRVGTPNGHGNVVQMLETLLGGQAGQDNRIAALEATVNSRTTTIEAVDTMREEIAARGARLDRHRAELDELRASRDRQGERLGAIEQDLAALNSAPPCRMTSTPTTGG